MAETSDMSSSGDARMANQENCGSKAERALDEDGAAAV
jgi:hypothetical protein